MSAFLTFSQSDIFLIFIGYVINHATINKKIGIGLPKKAPNAPKAGILILRLPQIPR